MDNAERGAIAEYLVACALDVSRAVKKVCKCGVKISAYGGLDFTIEG